MNDETRPHDPREADEFAARIRAARAYAGLTRPQLAKRIGRSKSTVERMEKADPAALGGTDHMRRSRIIRDVVAATGIPTAFFFEDWWNVKRGEVVSAEGDTREEVVASKARGLEERLARIEAELGLTELFDPKESADELARLLDKAAPPPSQESDENDSSA